MYTYIYICYSVRVDIYILQHVLLTIIRRRIYSTPSSIGPIVIVIIISSSISIIMISSSSINIIFIMIIIDIIICMYVY